MNEFQVVKIGDLFMVGVAIWAMVLAVFLIFGKAVPFLKWHKTKAILLLRFIWRKWGTYIIVWVVGLVIGYVLGMDFSITRQ